MNKKELVLPAIISLLIIALFGLLSLIRDPLRTLGVGASIYSSIETIIILGLPPAAPIIYGWLRGDKIGSMMIGIIPMAGFILGGLLIWGGPCTISEMVRSIAYVSSLSMTGGLAGYFASKRKLKYLLVAICFGILWIFSLISGIH
jgi:hypothetical protein